MEQTHDDTTPLRGYFLNYIAPSHFMPLLQIAKLFASRGVHVTFLNTRYNTALYRDSVEELVKQGYPIELDSIDFPADQVKLAEGVESFSSAHDRETSGKLMRGFFMLKEPMEEKVKAAKPDFIVADMHCFWASYYLGIPRLIYHGQAYFALSAQVSIRRHKPHETVQLESDPFLLPGLPQPIQMRPSEIPDCIRFPNEYTRFVNMVDEGDEKSYGVLVNSFDELEVDYAHHYRATLGRRAWSIGPLDPHCNAALKGVVDLSVKKMPRHPCLDWLDSMPAGKVVYVSFGSMSVFGPAQCHELATALESCGHPFVWVFPKCVDESLVKEFETRYLSNDNGKLITGWAPQVEILEHQAIGGFVTHCGLNSVVESVSAGVPLVAWPISAEHFYNRRLVMDVLKVGVDVGNQKWGTMVDPSVELITSKSIEIAIKELMGDGEEAQERRRRAKEIGEAAKKAVEKDGQSYNDLTNVIEELKGLRNGALNKMTEVMEYGS